MSSTSLASRIARVTAAVIAVSGTLVALVAGFSADRLVANEEDRRLVEAAKAFAEELRELGADSAQRAETEAEEFLYSGIHLAVYRGDRRLAGDARIRPGAPETCATRGGYRSCSVRHRDMLAVAASSTAPFERMRTRFAWMALASVLGTTLLGAMLALRLARYGIAPLDRLRRSVAAVSDRTDAVADLGGDEGVTEVDELRHALGDAFRRLAEALALSRRFATDAAHELRTPLTTLLGELELLGEQRGDDAELGSVVEKMHGAALRLATLVERLLVLATPAERLDVTEEVELTDLVDDARRASSAPERVKLVTTGSEGARMPGDAMLLSILVTNAIDNALKFAPGGDVTVRIHADGERVVLDFDDEGPGIPLAERERVFEPFHRAVGPGPRVRGHGIGLTLVTHVAAIHGGSARFVDGAKGARLRVEFPSARDLPKFFGPRTS